MKDDEMMRMAMVKEHPHEYEPPLTLLWMLILEFLNIIIMT
jgi:hypothetical protein